MRNVIRLLPLFVLLVAGFAEAQWTWTPQTGRFVNVRRMPKETAELQLEHARSLMLAGDYRQALRETEKFVEYYGNDPLADENLFLRGEIQMAQGRLLPAAQTFQQLIAAHPDTDRYHDAIALQYEIGDKFYDRGMRRAEQRFRLFRKRPFRRAAEVYTMVVDNQPFAPEAAEAQYKIGLSHFARNQYLDAAFEYRRVIEDYADSEWVNDASHGLALSYFRSSLPPEYDQTPSELTVIAIDDFVGRFPDDERVEELTGKREEMRESIAQQHLDVARFYERRREFSAAKIYYEMLVQEYADTNASEAAAAWLADNDSVQHVGDKYAQGIRSAL